MTEADFRARQRFEANDAGTDYTDAQYNDLRNDALTQLSRDIPFDTSATLGVTIGIKTYSKPADFITLQTTRRIPGYGGSTYGLGLTNSRYSIYRWETGSGARLIEDVDYYDYGTSLILSSAPTATEAWTLYYGGTWTITALRSELTTAVLHLATSRLYERKITENANGFSYRMGSESVDKSGIGDRWQSLANERKAAYELAIAPFRTNSSSFGAFDFDRR